jgi:predicted nuclease of restriction endonuclease-like (RecB) superfamily
VLIRIGLSEARAFYQIEAIRNNWSARELERQVTSLLFERLAKSRNKRALMRMAAKGHEIQRAADIFKDPLVMEFLGLPESARLLESDLEEALISNLQAFLLEMGKGFAFVARQERITLDSDLFYIDLVFYHTVLKCYVLIDLKAHKLTHEDLGQMLLYVNYFDKNRRTVGDNPTLGLILCSDKNDAVVRYTLGEHQEKIFARRYKLHLPSINELQQELQRNLLQLQGTQRVSKPTLLLASRKNNRQKATGSSPLSVPRSKASPKTTRGSIKGTASSTTGKAAPQKTRVRTAKNKKR